jgi:4-carboxymuconolactone decarboxylase
MSRLPNILAENFTPAQQQLFAHITGGKRSQGRAIETFVNAAGGLRGPFNPLLFSPNLGEATQRLGEAVRFEGTLPPQLRELAILTVAAKWQAHYEWWAHEKIATEVGLRAEIIAGVKMGGLPTSASPDETTVYDFARTLIDQHQVPEPPYQAAVTLLGEAGVVELVILLGYYTLIAMILNTFVVPLPEGVQTPFATPD